MYRHCSEIYVFEIPMRNHTYSFCCNGFLQRAQTCMLKTGTPWECHRLSAILRAFKCKVWHAPLFLSTIVQLLQALPSANAIKQVGQFLPGLLLLPPWLLLKLGTSSFQLRREKGPVFNSRHSQMHRDSWRKMVGLRGSKTVYSYPDNLEILSFKI